MKSQNEMKRKAVLIDWVRMKGREGRGGGERGNGRGEGERKGNWENGGEGGKGRGEEKDECGFIGVIDWLSRIYLDYGGKNGRRKGEIRGGLFNAVHRGGRNGTHWRDLYKDFLYYLRTGYTLLAPPFQPEGPDPHLSKPRKP